MPSKGKKWKEKEHGRMAIVFQGLATGTLLYVVFFEVLEKERRKKNQGILQVRKL